MTRSALVACFAALALACSGAGARREALVRAAIPGGGSAPLTPAEARRVAQMAASPMAFYRATIELQRRDWEDASTGLARTRFPLASLRAYGVGDAHVENFGTLLGRDGRVTLEVDDLDAAGPVAPLWDLRRLVVSLCLAARAAGLPAAAWRDVVRDASLAYAAALTGAEADASAPLLDDLLRRAARDAAARDELRELTVVGPEGRRLRRGLVDDVRLDDVSSEALRELPALVARYRETLTSPPEPGVFTVLDAARSLGRGGATQGRGRLLLLLRGAGDGPDDDVIVEAKALDGAAETEVARVLGARAALWTRPDADPYWGAAAWGRCPVQLRAETAAAKGVRVSRMRGAFAAPEAMRALGRALGGRLGAIHRRTLAGAREALDAVAADPGGFADEQAAAALRYADQVVDDHARFRGLAAGAGEGAGAARRGDARCPRFEAP
ncbi:MAG: DUF2252 family protein [Polyangiales bacterium]